MNLGDARALPLIFINFSYSGLVRNKERAILRNLRQGVLDNFESYSLGELSQFILGYSKLAESKDLSQGSTPEQQEKPGDEVLRKVDEKIRRSLGSLKVPDLVNLFSAYSNFVQEESREVSE